MALGPDMQPEEPNLPVGPVGSSEVAPLVSGPTALYTVTFRSTNAIASMTGLAGSREQAIATTITTALAATGASGSEVHIWQTAQITTVTGPSGVYQTSYNATAPLTGSTFVGVSHEDAIGQAVAAGPTGIGAGVAIFQTSP